MEINVIAYFKKIIFNSRNIVNISPVVLIFCYPLITNHRILEEFKNKVQNFVRYINFQVKYYLVILVNNSSREQTLLLYH